jgi:hypothetical protein
LDQSSIAYYDNLAREYVKEFPRSSLSDELSIKDQWEQAKKTLEIAKKVVYTGIKENEKPSEEYKKKGYTACRRQMALGGYRLADYFREIFGSSTENMLRESQ